MSLPLRSVQYSLPRTQFSSKKLKELLESNLVPPVINDCHVFGVRCVFDFCNNAEAVKQLAARRRILELKLRESEEVCIALYFHSLCSYYFHNFTH